VTLAYNPRERVYDRNELLRALSLALDLAEGQPFHHATRTAYAALQVARTLGLSEEQVENVYIAGFLHDIGATESLRDVSPKESGVWKHSQTGQELMRLMPFSTQAAEFVLWHHGSWEGLSEASQGGAPLGAQIVQLADQLELRYDRRQFYYDQRLELWDWARTQQNHGFDPVVVEAFLEASAKEKFWLDLTNPNLEGILREIQPNLTAQINQREVEQIANVFAAIIDSKSSYTYHHSRGVAEIMERLAPLFLESPADISQLKIAALLHDLGKLAVPRGVLDKPGLLTPQEFEQIKAHPYYTKMILGRVQGFEVIKDWAGNHHESIDGAGYPERKADLTVPERLMAVADVYQALTEERPYRGPMSSKAAIQIMQEMVRKRKLCPAGVALIQQVI